MSGSVTREQILQELKRVKGPDGKSDIVALGLVSEVVIHGGKVYFSIAVPPERAKQLEWLRRSAEKTVSGLSGVSSVAVTLTAERGAPAAPPGNGSGFDIRGAAQKPALRGIAEVRHIVAVASGKGGVGKSTTAVNLALALQANGLQSGVLDSDIYGPSIPRLLGITGKPAMLGQNTLEPMDGYGLKVMSMGFLVDEETPMIWRGPMVQSAILQMLRDVAWGPLDILVVDMPPGTGDAQLTLAQQVPLAGAIIVSTPQDLALIDARKGLNMFRRVNVPVLGIVENMSYFLCPACGHRADIFGHGGARLEAERLRVPFLGAVPLDMTIRETSDSGHPVVAGDPDSANARIYRDIAAEAWRHLTWAAGRRIAPKIVME